MSFLYNSKFIILIIIIFIFLWVRGRSERTVLVKATWKVGKRHCLISSRYEASFQLQSYKHARTHSLSPYAPLLTEPLNHDSHINHVFLSLLLWLQHQHHRFMARARPNSWSNHSCRGWSLCGDIHAPISEVSEPGSWYHTSSFRFLQIPRETSDPNPRKAHDSGPTF